MTSHLSETFLRAHAAPPPRTLIDILRATAHAHPQAAALDDGTVITYRELIELIDYGVTTFHKKGIRRGDRVGIRMPSGTNDLYIEILVTLAAGAAYVPVDADDPEERANTVFSEATVTATVTPDGIAVVGPSRGGDTQPPEPDDDAWIIFTSGSTGTPKGVAVTHRSAAAFVDAEARCFLAHAPGGPLGPDDRVLAGLSVAFDASCEEMWLAFGHGACLVPAPRALVKSGMDLGPWLISHDITVASTVPTLAGMWPTDALESVRLLILGGEACSAELVDRLAAEDREVWNTYGPTEATVVSCLTQLHPGTDVSIGFPLDGWDLTVVDPAGNPVEEGETGELIIGGVGLARYLDSDKDASAFAPMPQIGWGRAYRSGDHVRLERNGLYFVGRTDDQVKIGGRRIELGEVEAAVEALNNVRSGTVVVQKTAAGQKLLVAYLSLVDKQKGFDGANAKKKLATVVPAALVPLMHVMEDLPVKLSGKVNKDALPWPLPDTGTVDASFTTVETWLAKLWGDVLGVPATGRDDDFFNEGGTSLAAAALVTAMREKVPTISVRDVYDHPRLEALAERVTAVASTAGDDLEKIIQNKSSGFVGGGTESSPHSSSSYRPRHGTLPVPVGTATSVMQFPVLLLSATLRAATWVAWLAAGCAAAYAAGAPWAPATPWWLALILLIVFASPVGRLPLGALISRALTFDITPGVYPRGGFTHLRIWAADRLTDAVGARDIAGATWVLTYARVLGARIGKGVTLHSLPPVTGMLSLGDFSSVEPECDLSGMWVEGDNVHVGAVTIGAGARIGARTVLLPGAVIGADAHVEAGSTITAGTKVGAGARWAGAPARKVGRSKHRFPDAHPPRHRGWVAVYGATSMLLSLLPIVAIACGAVVSACLVGQRTGSAALGAAILATPAGAVTAILVFMGFTVVSVRLLGIGLKQAAESGATVVTDTGKTIVPGVYPVRSRIGWQVWATERLLDDARTHLFFLYASLATPAWFSLLGATVGRDVEISTAVMVPALTQIKDGAFLADDTMVGGYELGGGWMKTGITTIGKRSFLGNSGQTIPGRKLAKNSLVAVLSAAPKKSKAGTNWWGSPPQRMRRTIPARGCAAEEALTYQPSPGRKVARGLVEILRLFAPVVSYGLATAVAVAFITICSRISAATPAAGTLYGWLVAWLIGGVILLVAGLAAACVTVLVKWACVGQIVPGSHPLWSPFVWFNEVQDTFIEMVAAPWFLVHNQGTAFLTAFLRALGSRIGKGCWIESYWFPEADLIHVGDGVTIGPGCVVQTHLFQDRVMTLDRVRLSDGSTLAAQSVILPAAAIGEATTIGPGSLVMRGDHIPAWTRWQGNPVEPSRWV